MHAGRDDPRSNMQGITGQNMDGQMINNRQSLNNQSDDEENQENYKFTGAMKGD